MDIKQIYLQAIMKNDKQKIKEILSKICNVKYMLDIKDSLLISASAKGLLDVVKFLIQNKANVHELKDAPVRLACLHGHLDVVKYLVSCGANVHAEEEFALIFTCEYGHLDVVKYLIEVHGCNMRVNNYHPVRLSLVHNHQDIFDYLLSKDKYCCEIYKKYTEISPTTVVLK